MKILRLDLRAFGPFTDAALDLADGAEGLHLIYGPNEAGKSSALRALKQALYGIDARTTDRFVHDYDKLRVGGTLRHDDGSELAFLRRKGNKRTIRTDDDKADLDDAALAKFLAGVDRPKFEMLFGLDHDALVKGGREVAQGGGKAGDLVFGAGSDLPRLKRLRDTLDARAADLYKARGELPPLNVALKELSEARLAVESASLKSSEWVEHNRALAEARAERETLDAELAALGRERSRLERIRQALPDLARRRELAAILAELTDAPRLRDGFADERRASQQSLRDAERSGTAAAAELAAIADNLAGLDVPEDLLREGTTIEDLQRRLGAHQKESRDVARTRVEHRQQLAQAREILDDLGHDDIDPAADDSPARIQGLRLTRQQRERVRNLVGGGPARLGECDATSKRLDHLGDRRDEIVAAIDELPPARDIEPLRRAIRDAEREGDLQARLDKQRQELARLDRQARAALRKLAPWSGTLDEVDALAVPAAAQVDRADEQLDTAARDLASLEERVAEAEGQVADLDRKLERQRRERDVPSLDDLSAARARRDAAWQAIRRAWLDATPAEPGRADAYEQDAADADALSDRIREEIDRVKDRDRWLADRADAADRLDGLRRRHEEATRRLDAARAAWADLLAPVGIEPDVPRSMRPWLVDHEKLRQQLDLIRDARDAVHALADSIESHRARIANLLRGLGERPPREDEALADLADRARTLVGRIEATEARRTQLQQALRDNDRELADARDEDEDARRRLAEWRATWAEMMAALHLPADSADSVALAVLEQNGQLFTALDKAARLAERIEAFERDQATLGEDVRELTARVATDLDHSPMEAAIIELDARLTHARTNQARRSELLDRQARLQRAADNAARERDAAREQLADLCREAGCDDPAGLEAIESRAADRREAERERAAVEDRLRALGAGAAVAEFAAEAEAVDPDTLPARVAELDETIAGLSVRRDDAVERIGREDKAIEQMEETARAAKACEAAAGMQHLLAKIEAGVGRYARLKLASAVLRESIELYRRRNQDPILRRAGELFATLTRGSFEALQPDLDEKDEPILVGVRAGGKETVGVSGMSEGTCDQLFLALKLAAVEHHLDHHARLPFVVDDILVHFDDDRAGAALEALASLSRRTQVLFFTHHRHLVDVAESRLAPGVLFTHRLGR